MGKNDIDYTESSGNVFADMGLPDPEERMVKARLARIINRVIEQRGWTQKQAADALDITQPKISNLSRGRLKNVSVEQLMRFLSRLDQRVTITVSGDALPSEEIVIAARELAKEGSPKGDRG